MIPLNKPKIYPKALNYKDKSIEEVLIDFFNNRNIELVFSARQGLDIIYKDLFKIKGSCNVAVSPLTCFDALYPIINNNHSIVFVDINPETFNMDENLIPKGIDVVQAIHFGGNPQNMDLLNQYIQENSSILVEDCAQAFGSIYKNKLMGSFGDYSAFSFVKNLYALGGGFILSKEEIEIPSFGESSFNLRFYRELKRYIESKNTYNSFFFETILMTLLKLKPRDTSYVFSENKVDYKMINSIEIQLSHFKELVRKRQKVAVRIRSAINNNNLIEQEIIKMGSSNFTRLLFKLKKGKAVDYIEKLRSHKIWANHLSQNTLINYQQSVLRTKEFKGFAHCNKLIEYKKIHDRIISIPISPILNENEIKHIIHQVNKL